MRLIDADKLIEDLKNLAKGQVPSCPNIAEYFVSIRADKIIDRLNNEPTAYDVDKVVEQLEKQRKMYEQESEELEKMRDDPNQIIYRRGKMRGFEYSKEIVKDGGIGKNDNK